MGLLRRTLLAGSAAFAPLLSLIGCGPGSRQAIRHILPSVTDSSISLTCSLTQPVQALYVRIRNKGYVGRQCDSKGLHWSFVLEGLSPDTHYELQLLDSDDPVGEAWSLRTFPAEDVDADVLTLAAFTCAGGGDGFGFNGLQYFKPHSFRQHLFDELLSQSPDAVIAIGDHIYWDLRGGERPPLGRRRSALVRWVIGVYLKAKYGAFDRSLPLIGTANEAVLKRIADEQIADLYGTRFKSTPIYFVSDDHDYFENDDAEEDLVTFPADRFSREAHRAVADLYYPALPGSPSQELKRSFGILRYGSLFEAPLLDCAGFMTLDNENAVLIPHSVEDWLSARIEHSDATHLVVVPSHPVGWTAGKWREWYPDVVALAGFEGVVTNELNFDGATQGVLSANAQKYLWQIGWWEQHQRLLKMLAARSGSRFMLSGDIHAQGAVKVRRSGDYDLSLNPIVSVLTGPVSTSDATWPSFARGIPASQPEWLNTEIITPTSEVNGFALVTLTKQTATVTLHNCDGQCGGADGGSVENIIEFSVL